jgi:hypothetical protein
MNWASDIAAHRSGCGLPAQTERIHFEIVMAVEGEEQGSGCSQVKLVGLPVKGFAIASQRGKLYSDLPQFFLHLILF